MRGKHLEGDFLNIAVVVIVAGALITAIFGITIASGRLPGRLSSRASPTGSTRRL
jgi:hypothetical protein